MSRVFNKETIFTCSSNLGKGTENFFRSFVFMCGIVEPTEILKSLFLPIEELK